MYALIVVDDTTGEITLATSDGTLIVGTRDEMRTLSPRGAVIRIPDSIGPFVTAPEVRRNSRREPKGLKHATQDGR
jgi:hypothetical protein